MHSLLGPGNWIGDRLGLAADSDHRTILRLYANTAFWCVAVLSGAFLVSV